MTFKKLFVRCGLMEVDFRRRIIGVDARPEDVAELPSGAQYKVLRELGPDYVPTGVSGVVQSRLDKYTDDGQRLTRVFERSDPEVEGEYRIRGSLPVYRTSQEPGVPRPAFNPVVPGLR